MPRIPLVPPLSWSELVKKTGTISPKPEGDDCEVIAAQAQRGCAQQDAEQSGDDRARDQPRPERNVHAAELRRDQRVRVRADGEECGVAKVEQTGHADHDVEADGEQDVDPGGGERVDPDALSRKPLKGGSEHDSGTAAVMIAIEMMIEMDRCRPEEVAHPIANEIGAAASGRGCAVVMLAHPSGTPSRPDGRNTRTMISTAKTSASDQRARPMTAADLDEADDDAAQGRAHRVADATQHGGGERLQTGEEADRELVWP